MAAPPPPPRGTMSLYAELLGGPAEPPQPAPAPAPAPTAAKPPEKNPTLLFQPIIRRPQQKKAAGHPKPKPPPGLPPAGPVAPVAALPAAHPAAPPRPNPLLPDPDAADDEFEYDDFPAPGHRPQRGGRKGKKKRLERRAAAVNSLDVDWDEIYDPARPTNLEAYMQSDERVAAAREWKAVLFARREAEAAAKRGQRTRSKTRSRSQSLSDSSSSDDRGRPPFSYAFAPPPSLTAPSAPSAPPAPPSPPRAVTPPPPGLVVSRPPIRFAAAAPAPDVDMPDVRDDDDAYEPPPASPPPLQEPSSRPGQAGFAARLMAKYGWSKGSGLGADGSGIVNPLRHKKMGGANSSRGRIVGGARPRTEGQNANTTPAPSSSPSTVIVLRNMVEGMPDLAAEVADGQLVQEIGEECGDQYGRVERVYIDVATRLVFIQFTDAVSALRAVNALDGRIFNGNAIQPNYYNADKFEQGIYE